MSDIPRRVLGRTGERVSALGVGGWHLGLPKLSQAAVTRLVRTAIDRGVTFFDNSWDYHNGQSEIRLGKALVDGYRDRAFVATGIAGRTQEEATRQVDESLRRLRVDYIDLVHHHEVIRYEDPDRIFYDEGGAHDALVAAREGGKIRYIGFSGHKDPSIHLRMLQVAEARGFIFDAVQLPLNLMDAHFRSFAEQVVPELTAQGIAVLGMKPLASGLILRSDLATPTECLHYALTLPTSVVITGIESLERLDQACEAGGRFIPLSHRDLSELLSRTADAAAHGLFEPYKTSSIFDHTAQHPEWLGKEPKWLQELMP